jgi:hypothetical protein
MLNHRMLGWDGPSPVGGTPGVTGVGVGAGTAVRVGAGPQPDGTVMVSLVVETVPPKERALPVQRTVLPMVLPAASTSLPTNVEVAPSVVAWIGVHQTSHADAPPAVATTELADVADCAVCGVGGQVNRTRCEGECAWFSSQGAKRRPLIQARLGICAVSSMGGPVDRWSHSGRGGVSKISVDGRPHHGIGVGAGEDAERAGHPQPW